MTLIRNVLDSRLYPQHWLHLPFFALTHTKLSSHWTTTTQPPQQKHVQIQIHPLPDLSNDFPCFSRGFPHKFFPPGFRVSAPQRRQVGREDLARPRGSAADIPAEVRAAGRFAEHQEGDQGPGRWGQRGWIFSGEYIMIYIW